MQRRSVWEDVPGAMVGCIALVLSGCTICAAILGVIWLWKKVF